MHAYVLCDVTGQSQGGNSSSSLNDAVECCPLSRMMPMPTESPQVAPAPRKNAVDSHCRLSRILYYFFIIVKADVVEWPKRSSLCYTVYKTEELADGTVIAYDKGVLKGDVGLNATGIRAIQLQNGDLRIQWNPVSNSQFMLLLKKRNNFTIE